MQGPGTGLKWDYLAWHRSLRLGIKVSKLTPGFDAAQGKQEEDDLGSMAVCRGGR